MAAANIAKTSESGITSAKAISSFRYTFTPG